MSETSSRVQRRSPRFAHVEESCAQSDELLPPLRGSRSAERDVAAKSVQSGGDFGGPIGCSLMMVLLPLFMILWGNACHSSDKCVTFSRLNDFRLVTSWIPPLSLWFRWEAFLIVIGWVVFQGVLHEILPGEIVKGTPVAQLGGAKLNYKMNGHLQFWVNLTLIAVGIPRIEGGLFVGFTAWPLDVLYDLFFPLMIASFALSLILSFMFYVTSLREACVTSPAAERRNFFVDFFMGRELNPRWFTWMDWKVLLDLRPSLIGWMVLNIGFMMAARKVNGHVSTAHLVLSICQGIYTWDALLFESSILSTMDITTEGLGMMLTFGNLCWVPFLYSLQGHYLAHSRSDLSNIGVAAFALLFAFGYWIFRSSNNEKVGFRFNPKEFSHLKTMATKSGRKLLISGWWGRARKINYLGDIIIGLAWCGLSGFKSPIPFFYFPYIISLLLHRMWRDDTACKLKYGKDWDIYKQRVPYVLIPGIV